MPIPDISIYKATSKNLFSHVIWLLTLIISRESLESSANLLILTLTNSAFELECSLSHPSVVTSNLTSPGLPMVRLLSRMICLLICQSVSILDGQFLKSELNHFFLTVLGMILKKPTKDEKLAVNCGYVWRDI